MDIRDKKKKNIPKKVYDIVKMEKIIKRCFEDMNCSQYYKEERIRQVCREERILVSDLYHYMMERKYGIVSLN